MGGWQKQANQERKLPIPSSNTEAREPRTQVGITHKGGTIPALNFTVRRSLALSLLRTNEGLQSRPVLKAEISLEAARCEPSSQKVPLCYHSAAILMGRNTSRLP